MDEKPSPGPWRWRTSKEGGRSLIDADGRDVLFCSNDAEEIFAGRPADAALIADAWQLPQLRQQNVQFQRDMESVQRLLVATEDTAKAALDLLREIGTSDDPDYIGPEWWQKVAALLKKHGRG